MDLQSESFRLLARAYDRARPPIPNEAVEWLTDPKTQPYLEALELGAGVGRFTAQLMNWIPTMHAIEPDRRLLTMLRWECPMAVATLGCGEAIPLSDDSVDAVFAAGSWDWFEPYAATAEVARVLRPGGRFGVVWNVRDHSVPWVAELDKVTTHHQERLREPVMFALPEGAPFSSPEQKTISSDWKIHSADLGLLFGSFRQVLNMSAEERAAVLTAAERYLTEHPELVDGDVVHVPTRTVCWRTQFEEKPR